MDRVVLILELVLVRRTAGRCGSGGTVGLRLPSRGGSGSMWSVACGRRRPLKGLSRLLRLACSCTKSVEPNL